MHAPRDGSFPVRGTQDHPSPVRSFDIRGAAPRKERSGRRACDRSLNISTFTVVAILTRHYYMVFTPNIADEDMRAAGRPKPT